MDIDGCKPGGRCTAKMCCIHYNTKHTPGQLLGYGAYVKISPMRVLQINSVCTGSTGRICAGISRVLREAGHESLILYGRGAPAQGVSCERIESKLAFYLHVLYARLTDRQGFASTSATRRMVRRIQSYKPDVIHLQNLHGYYLDWRVLFSYLKYAEIPVVWTLHDCNAFTGHCAHFDLVGCERWREHCGRCPLKKEYPKSVLLDRSERNYYEKRALTQGLGRLAIVTPSRWLADLASESFLGGYTIQTIHNGVDLEVFKPEESDLRTRFGLEGQRIVLGVSKFWEPRKGLGTFFDLAERLEGKASVVLVGLSSAQLATLPKGIVGIGRTENARELAAWYSAADVFVNPSLEDTFPTTQIEAIACGTPVVCYDAGGCAESLDDSCGVVVPKGDFPALADAVLSAVGLKRENCVRRAKLFDQRERFGDYLKLYLRMIGEDDA